MTDANERSEIRVVRLDHADGAERRGEVTVVFEIRRGSVCFHVPVNVSVRSFDEAEAIRIGRHYLHHLFLTLGEASAGWHLDQAEIDRLSTGR
jgi:hypothetical protein